ncbi:hypothetical protein [Haladaptatus salinisoli]|uniref:hypothetical protein n=1 Tax=Haladaptatus salinisoli TaxID=2884876 RepID=UPI001D0BA830|nr:hypothetical protein [Haladaptatus salinisoli]
MTCQNCGHTDSFVLLLDVAARITETDIAPLDWSLAVQCPRCESTHVAADPGDLLARIQNSTTQS